jgi:hypothetical protein
MQFGIKQWVLSLLLGAICFGVGCQSTPQSPTDVLATPTDTPTIPAIATLTDVSSEGTSSQAVSSKEESSKATSKPSSSSSSKTSSKPKPSSTASKPVTVKKPETNQTKIVNYVTRPTYASVQKEIAALAEAYPELVQTASIGSSVQGRNLTLVQVGKGAAKACVVAGFHAREHITVSYTMRCIEEMCAAYTSDSGKWGSYDMKTLLEQYTLYFVPLVNPDGLEIISGRAKPNVAITYRKDKVTGKMATISDYKATANGVNLNKNFPLLWEQVDTKVPTPDAENYKGTAPASEPETQALISLCEQNAFLWMTSFHVRGDCVYWSDSLNPNVGLSQTMVNQLKSRCGFYKCPTSKDVNGYGGGFENWFRQTYKKPGLCVELMPLTVNVTGTSDGNHQNFSSSVRWSSTYQVLPLLMQTGYSG